MSHVAGYTMSNDISTRDVMFRPGFPMTDFLMTKMRPTFFPTGPLRRSNRVRARLPRAADHAEASTAR